MTRLRNKSPAGLPSPEALQTAIDTLSRRHIQPETALHPVVLDQARELALLLSAYGLVPTEPPLAAERGARHAADPVGRRPIDPAARPGAASAGSLLRMTGRRAEGASLARLPVWPTGALTLPACRAQRGRAGS
jgi:hypothetical protein